ncbi:unnamed protein product [Adineta steineri]|uniref:Uncharacterized protein n=1 Tax=Adineta steineri TaxID=433720 RepID=A0A814GUT9_9BILA|nr:unnamed protein product [Adineta steineri]CAF1303324.1 unnamed protein product [Adineta steineri]CAF1304368.1 unnamed protein product [Adineta steineri]
MLNGLYKGAKYTITHGGDKCILVINNVIPDDVDEYSIKARNKAPTRFRLPLKYQNILNYEKGESVVVKILYTGGPLLNVMLSKDGNDITKDKNVSIDISNRPMALTIRNGNKNTTGHQPERVTLKHGNIYDYYDIVKEIGR